MMPFRHITPVEPRDASGLVTEVYSQQARDMGLSRMPALMTLSPVPELLAATWSLLRESLVAGPVSRTERELVALGVSMRNQCPFCVDAHTMLLHATGDHRLAESIARGERPADPRQAALLDGRGLDAPELVAVALTFHFINRMVSALHTPEVLPAGLARLRPVRSLAGRSLAGAARRVAPPGDSLRLLPVRPEAPAWAGDSPAGTAYAALVELAGRPLGPWCEAVRAEVAAWDGAHPGLAGPALSEEHGPRFRLAALAALAPYRIGERDVAAAGLDDAELVRVLAFGAITAVRRQESLLPGIRL
ncbi:carboxymuconolactone decarboxylase family protein [Nonomuraea sp. NPDC050310]|uniref:carboxymuconolactone decarboxylase family protein n=1 Tax=Nonomuraea sp. NPDC050310 TaxID=3154935 RepID=UPI0034088A16